MKRLCAFLATILCQTCGVLAIVQPGDSVNKMRLELGEPTGQIQRGEVMIYSYPQGGIYVEDGHVTKLSEGFYGRLDQISKQSSEGTIEMTVGSNSLIAGENPPEPPAPSTLPGVLPYNGEWLTDVAMGEAIAKQRAVPLFLLFTGSDWCVWCQKLDTEILQTPVFKDFAKESLVLVKLDFPKDKQLPSKLAEQNRQQQELWNVEGYPTILLLDNELKELGRTGYLELDPQAYVDHLKILISGEQPTGPDGMGTSILGEDFDKILNQLGLIDKVTGSSMLLSAQIIVGCILAFLLIRRLMRK